MKSHGIASLIVLVLAATQVSGDPMPIAEGDREQAKETAGVACCGAGAGDEPAGDEASPGGEYSVDHCPLYLTFNMNGVFYYYCQVCDGTCNTYAGAQDSTSHTTDGDCVNCPPGDSGCRWPIEVDTREATGAKPVRGMLARTSRSHVIGANAKLSQLVPPRRGSDTNPGPPGTSGHPDGTLNIVQSWVNHMPGSDRVVLVRDGGGRPRFFRVFVLYAEPPDKPRVEFYVGQQLHPSKLGFQQPLRGCIVPGMGDGWQHVIHIHQDPAYAYHVLSFDELEKPTAACP
jgi:hypothetical protein